jgi:hypothetical protein
MPYAPSGSNRNRWTRRRRRSIILPSVISDKE